METKDEPLSHLPPVRISLFQKNKSLSLPDADLPSIIPPVVVVILGLQNHCTAGDAANCNPTGRLCGSCSRLLVSHRAPPGPWEHDFKRSSSARCAGSRLTVDTGDTGGVSSRKVRQEPGQGHALQRDNEGERLASREVSQRCVRLQSRSWLCPWLIAQLIAYQS